MSQQTTNRTFDELASGLASGSISRGRALRLMGAALVGGTLASLGIREAAADEECKPLNKKCRKNHQCCSEVCTDGTCAACPPGTKLCSNGQCAPVASCCDNADCSGCATCQSGTCVCPQDTVHKVLANGTCARSCDIFGPCNPCFVTDEGTFCAVEEIVGGCENSNLQCPPGSLCNGFACLTVAC